MGWGGGGGEREIGREGGRERDKERSRLVTGHDCQLFSAPVGWFLPHRQGVVWPSKRKWVRNVSQRLCKRLECVNDLGCTLVPVSRCSCFVFTGCGLLEQNVLFDKTEKRKH